MLIADVGKSLPDLVYRNMCILLAGLFHVVEMGSGWFSGVGGFAHSEILSETSVWVRGVEESLWKDSLGCGWDWEIGVVRFGDLSSSYFTALAVAVLLVV